MTRPPVSTPATLVPSGDALRHQHAWAVSTAAPRPALGFGSGAGKSPLRLQNHGDSPPSVATFHALSHGSPALHPLTKIELRSDKSDAAQPAAPPVSPLLRSAFRAGGGTSSAADGRGRQRRSPL